MNTNSMCTLICFTISIGIATSVIGHRPVVAFTNSIIAHDPHVSVSASARFIIRGADTSEGGDRQMSSQSDSDNDGDLPVLLGDWYTLDDGEWSDTTTPTTKTVPEYAYNPEKKREELGLGWSIAEANDECQLNVFTDTMTDGCGKTCLTCDGHGEVECRFCHGTGFFTIGEVRTREWDS